MRSAEQATFRIRWQHAHVPGPDRSSLSTDPPNSMPATTGSAAARLAAFGTPGDPVRLGACYAYARWRRRRMICSRPRHVELLCCAPLMHGRFRGGDALACHQRIPRRCFASSSSLSSSSLLTQGRPGFIPCVNLYIRHMHTTPNGRRTPSLFVPRDNSRQPCLANQEKRRPIFSPPFLRF